MDTEDGMVERARKFLYVQKAWHSGNCICAACGDLLLIEFRAIRREALEEAVRSLESVKQSRDPEVFRGMVGPECDAEGWRKLTYGERVVLKAGTDKIRALIEREK